MKILGYHYKMVMKPKKNMDELGNCEATKLKIRIRKQQAPQQQQSTVLHEMLHAISYHLHLELTEQQVMSLESGLYQSLTDNGVDLSPLTKELE